MSKNVKNYQNFTKTDLRDKGWAWWASAKSCGGDRRKNLYRKESDGCRLDTLRLLGELSAPIQITRATINFSCQSSDDLFDLSTVEPGFMGLRNAGHLSTWDSFPWYGETSFAFHKPWLCGTPGYVGHGPLSVPLIQVRLYYETRRFLDITNKSLSP